MYLEDEDEYSSLLKPSLLYESHRNKTEMRRRRFYLCAFLYSDLNRSAGVKVKGGITRGVVFSAFRNLQCHTPYLRLKFQ